MANKNCCICEKDNASYKCPVCWKPYCSITCCKQHKTQSCEPSEKSEKHLNASEENIVKYEFPTEDTVVPEKLQLLRHSKELKVCLSNSHLRDIMKGVLNSKNPTNAIALAMREPLFVEMADACLKVVEPQDTAPSIDF